jgi:large subunit ribosomal protein L25
MSTPDSMTVECELRAEGSKAKALRRAGRIPANIYGHKGGESVLVTIDAKSFGLMLRTARVRKTPIALSIPSESWSGTAVLQEVQAHPWKSFIYHVSFFVTDPA